MVGWRWGWRWDGNGNASSALTPMFRLHRHMGVIVVFSSVVNVIIVIVIVVILVVIVIFVIVVVIMIRFRGIVTVSHICLPARGFCRIACGQRTFGGCAGTRCKVFIREYIMIEWANATLGPGFLDGFQ
jgi:hypothetical protein